MRIPADLPARMNKKEGWERAGALGGFLTKVQRRGIFVRLVDVGMPPVLALDLSFLCFPDDGHAFWFRRRDFNERDRATLRENNSDVVLGEIARNGVTRVAQHVCDMAALGQMPWPAPAFVFFRDFDENQTSETATKVRVTCRECGEAGDVPSTWVGKTIRCKGCRGTIVV